MLAKLMFLFGHIIYADEFMQKIMGLQNFKIRYSILKCVDCEMRLVCFGNDGIPHPCKCDVTIDVKIRKDYCICGQNIWEK